MYTLDSTSFLFPIVADQGRVTVTIGNNPVKVTDTPRKMYLLRNNSQDAILYIGGSPNVTVDNGFPILPGEVMYLNTASDIYVVSKSLNSQQVAPSNTEIELRYMIFS